MVELGFSSKCLIQSIFLKQGIEALEWLDGCVGGVHGRSNEETEQQEKE